MAARWLTMAEYAQQRGISREAVRKAVHAGRIESNGKAGRECRVRGEMAESVRITVPEKTGAEQADLMSVKLEKIRADIEFQRQRISQNRRALQREMAEVFIEEYVRAFAPVKAELTALRLDAEKLAALRTLIDTCAAVFESAVRKRMVEDGCD